MKIPENYLGIKTGRLNLDNWLKINYPEFYEYLKNKYTNIDIKTSMYMYYNNISEIPKCVCGNPVKFHGYSYGFSKFCCPKCAANDKDVQNKLKNSLENKYGVNARKIINDKGRNTKKHRYGDPNFNNINKAKQTWLEKYGVDNPMKSNVVQNRSKQTCLEKYGTEYFLNSDEYMSQKTKYLDKAKQTCLEKYGGLNSMSDEDVKNKVKQTCLERYGVEWNCMRPEAKNSRNFNSKPNEEFKKLLEQNNIPYEREFKINNRLYDFKVRNTLIEINPSPTHNINWNPYGGKIIDNMYHFTKTINGKSQGYNVINVWDWDDVHKIIYIINKNKIKIGARCCDVREICNKKCNEFLNKYHLQNSCKSQKIKIGLYYKDILLGVMTFGKPRYNKNYDWELLRLCYHKDYNIIGGSEKMFSYFIKNYNPNNILTYCDMSKFNGNIYEKLGFQPLKTIKPSKHWYNCKTNQHITDNLLRSNGFDRLFGGEFGKGSSNDDLMRFHGFVEIYDAGQKTFIWKKTP